MKLNSLPNFRVEDFPAEFSQIASRLFTQLNPFIQSVNQVFDQNVDFISNIKAITKDYTISSFQEFSLTWPYKEIAPIDLRVTKAYRGTQLTPTVLLPAWKYDSTSALITITNLIELSSTGVASLSGRYNFTIRASI